MMFHCELIVLTLTHNCDSSGVVFMFYVVLLSLSHRRLPCAVKRCALLWGKMTPSNTL